MKGVLSGTILLSCAGLSRAAGNLDKGKALYESHCLRCHSKTAEGSEAMAKKFKVARSAMDLTSVEVREAKDEFLVAFIKEGKGPMPAFGGKLKPDQIEDVLAYARSLRGRALGFGAYAKGDLDAELVARRFTAHCAYCHGRDGKGNIGMARVFKVEQHAMDLTSAETQALEDSQLQAVIADGKGHMPAFAQALKPEEIQALVANVRSLKRAEKKDSN